MAPPRRLAPRLAVVVAGLIALAAPAAASTFESIGFRRLTSFGSADAAAQIDVGFAADGTRALFRFGLAAGPNPDAVIMDIWFSDPNGLFVPPPQIVATTGTVLFEAGGTNVPANVPGNGAVSPPFVPTAALVAESIRVGTGGTVLNEDNVANGVAIGESLTLGLVYAAGKGFSNLVSDLSSGAFRIALRLRDVAVPDGFTGSARDGFVSTPIPLPAGAWLALTGLGAAVLLRRPRRA